jgi:hypothetical protein
LVLATVASTKVTSRHEYNRDSEYFFSRSKTQPVTC